ncbi:MAG: chlorite dismutase family protein [Sulfolobaceae archaeon]
MSSSVYMYISSLKFNSNWWNLSYSEKKGIISNLLEVEKAFSEKVVLKRYISLRHNSDLLYWISSYNTRDFIEFKYNILSIGKGYFKENIGLISIFKPSPYFEYSESKDLLSYIKREPLRYFVAYPMKKSPEWYLLPFDERRELIKEHAEIASKYNKYGIRSYTTYSFGILDDEFVVIYEVPDLEGWSFVVEKLREARARKWTLREEPILLGEYINLQEIIK